MLFPGAKAEAIVGTIASVTGVSYGWTADIFPIISEIAICAGAVVALHGIIKIVIGYIRYFRNGYMPNHEDDY